MLFDSFFLGGFECATGYDRIGRRIDLIAATGHDRFADADYRLLRAAGLRAARDAVRWPLVDRGRGRYDFASVEPVLRAAERHRVAVVWDLFHYGYPDGCDPFAPGFAERFAAYAAACARHLRARCDGTLWFTPVNEPSFLAWAGGDMALFAPHAKGRGPELKRALVRAAIAGVDAIRAEVPGARMLSVDPVCHVVPRDAGADARRDAHAFNHGAVFECWDMLAGRLHPELGGSRAHLDVVGINYYWNCQWELGSSGTWLADDDPRRVPLRELVQRVWRRYGGGVLIAETAHWGEHRGRWIGELADECVALRAEGVPLGGACLYPVLGMPDWHDPDAWVPMGLWDIARDDGLRRVPHAPALEALGRARQRLERR